MTDKLYHRIELAERFASDLTHEIRNPLASLRGASDLLNQTKDDNQKVKLLKILSNIFLHYDSSLPQKFLALAKKVKQNL